jgi:ABC-type nitrate/sulfonate/bicarbonate transport system substrate-binding protein
MMEGAKMTRRTSRWLSWSVALLALLAISLAPRSASAADKLVGIYAARVMSQSLPWIAREAGLFKKHNLDFELKYIASSSMVTAAMLSGEAEVGLVGSVGIIQAVVKGATDLVFIGGVKNTLTHSILAKPEIKRGEDLKGKKVGITRFGSNTHYFATQAARRLGLDPGRDFTFIQTGGEPEMFTALVSGAIDAAAMTAPMDARAISQGFHYLVYGPDLRIPYLATAFVTRRSVIASRPQVVAQFMRTMAEAAKLIHTDRELTYRVLAKELRLDDRKVLEAAYNSEIKALEQRFEIKRDGLEAVLEEVAQTDPKAKSVKPQDLVDRRFVDEMERSGFFDKLWGK